MNLRSHASRAHMLTNCATPRWCIWLSRMDSHHHSWLQRPESYFRRQEITWEQVRESNPLSRAYEAREIPFLQPASWDRLASGIAYPFVSCDLFRLTQPQTSFAPRRITILAARKRLDNYQLTRLGRSSGVVFSRTTLS